jgi:hypothetical protein
VGHLIGDCVIGETIRKTYEPELGMIIEAVVAGKGKSG